MQNVEKKFSIQTLNPLQHSTLKLLCNNNILENLPSSFKEDLVKENKQIFYFNICNG